MKRLGAIVLLAVTAVCAQQASKWVYFGADHRLHYKADDRGNRIMDFSFAGYRGGGVKLPRVAVAKELGPEAGDNTARIQAAIDEVSAKAPNSDGVRGAVLLRPGT